MEYTIRDMIARKGLALEDTVYRNSNADMLDFRLFSGDFYDPINGKLRFKGRLIVMDYPRVLEAFPPFARFSHKGREKFPYFVDNLDGLMAARERGEPIAVKGGPGLFGDHEVTVTVHLSDGQTRLFDYATGKKYLNEESRAELQEGTSGLAEFLRTNADRVRGIDFQRNKWALTPQEYFNIRLPFELADALGGPLALPLPDMSYRKYLLAALEFVPDALREKALADFDRILYNIADLFLDVIYKLQDHFQIRPFSCVHLRNPDAVNLWYERRPAYIERSTIMSGLTRIPGKFEPVKDYISTPALPFYLFGSRSVLQVDSVDETDSYRKCRKAHKKVLNMGCIMIPELLCGDGVHTVYSAPLEWKEKEYGRYVEDWASIL